jgi:hypothetical protein
MTDTCIVSGHLIDPTGALAPNTKVVIRAGGVVGQYGKTVLPKEITAISDGSGVLSVPLMPGLYTGLVADTGRTWQFPISVPEAETAALADCIKPAAPPITPGDVVLSQAARDAAQAAQAAAELAETNAETAETNAEAAQVAAEGARDTAIDAATTATTQAGVATTQAGLASTARTGAETARTGAETARTGAETAQTGAQTARTAAETAQTGAQTARTGAEAARDIALGAQAAAQLAAAAITPMDVLHLVSQGSYTFPVPSGWWDTGLRQTATDSLRGTTSTMAIISNWNAETLRGTGPNVFILAHDTARIFGADGVTAVSAPGTAVALAADDWQGLTLGSELNPDPGFDSATGWTLGTGWSVTGGRAQVVAGGANADISRAIAGVTVGKSYLVEVTDLDFVSGTSFRVIFGGAGVGADYTTDAPGTRRIVVATSTDGLRVRAISAGSEGSVAGVSVKEILNWPAYQNTAAARPTWGRAPAQVRNLLTNSDLAGAVAGTPGTAPTGYSMSGVPGTVVAVGEGFIDFSASANRPFLNAPSVTVNPGQTVTASYIAELLTGASTLAQTLIGWTGTLSSPTSQYRINGNPVAASATVSQGDVVSLSLTAGATGGAVNFRLGLGCDAPTTGTLRMRNIQAEVGTARTAYQRRGATPTDVTESGVTSFGLLSFDGSDDALLHQLAAGGTVAVALFGRGGSFLIPSITLAAPSVLQLGPLSALDDGVLVSGCPTGILRAVGTVPWSSRLELVGYAIMKANPSAEEQARAMRYFAAHGAGGWLVEGPELATNGDFSSGTSGWLDFGAGTGWNVVGGKAVHTAGTYGTIRKTNAELPMVAGQAYILRFDLSDRLNSSVFVYGRVLLTPTPLSVNGSYAYAFVAPATGNSIAFEANTAFDGAIDNVSLRALTPEF